jgi:hypothetical protein
MMGCAGFLWAYVAIMDWQQFVALSVVAVTAILFAVAKFRRRSFSFERDTHCGCAGVRPGAQQRIIFRARKGQRREVEVKMG